MRRPDAPGERGAVDERGAAGQRHGDDLRQRLGRLSAGHPSSPEYEQVTDPGELPESAELAEPGELPESGAAAQDADRAAEDQGGQDGLPDGRSGSGGPAGWRTGEVGTRPQWRAAGGLTGRTEPYRPWFTAGESPDPWFTDEPEG